MLSPLLHPKTSCLNKRLGGTSCTIELVTDIMQNCSRMAACDSVLLSTPPVLTTSCILPVEPSCAHQQAPNGGPNLDPSRDHMMYKAAAAATRSQKRCPSKHVLLSTPKCLTAWCKAVRTPGTLNSKHQPASQLVVQLCKATNSPTPTPPLQLVCTFLRSHNSLQDQHEQALQLAAQLCTTTRAITDGSSSAC